MSNLETQHRRVEIGNRARCLGLAKGITHCNFAAALGHSSCTRINETELGRLRLYTEEPQGLCGRLGCALSDIVDE